MSDLKEHGRKTDRFNGYPCGCQLCDPPKHKTSRLIASHRRNDKRTLARNRRRAEARIVEEQIASHSEDYLGDEWDADEPCGWWDDTDEWSPVKQARYERIEAKYGDMIRAVREAVA